MSLERLKNHRNIRLLTSLIVSETSHLLDVQSGWKAIINIISFSFFLFTLKFLERGLLDKYHGIAKLYKNVINVSLHKFRV